MALDTSKFPERKVVRATVVPVETQAWRMGSRWSLELSCGHVLGFKHSDNVPESVKCLLCHSEQVNG